ncbi:hypothetical protein GF354_00595 [Candidatus Peregrinibacteria bacterium]|nr:hypothetical protein [Candidatus Peregrinibacteria bacterium]
MTGKDIEHIELNDIWESWWQYKKGKKKTPEFYQFEYYLENNLSKIYQDITNRTYTHSEYRTFSVCDNKPRRITEACLKDKIVHRLVYDYLVSVYDESFDYDVWSGRKGKGLIAAIFRVQKLLFKFPKSYIWKADIRKFFDHIDHQILYELIELKVNDEVFLFLIREIISSYSYKSGKGLPLGNLTSQIFANIYLNEFDHFVRHNLKSDAYLRYGDDFILIMKDRAELCMAKKCAIEFLEDKLQLFIKENDLIVKVNQGLKFLGMKISVDSVFLNKRNVKRIFKKLNSNNLPSYFGLIQRFGSEELTSNFHWKVFALLGKHKPSPSADNADYCSDC